MPSSPTALVRSRAIASFRKGLNQSSSDVEEQAVAATLPCEDILWCEA